MSLMSRATSKLKKYHTMMIHLMNEPNKSTSDNNNNTLLFKRILGYNVICFIVYNYLY